MTKQAKPALLPAHDLSAFDLSKQSPEQLAQSFAHWKAQRKRSLEEPRGSQLLQAQPRVAIVGDAAPDPSPANEAAESLPAERTKPVEYSGPFSALLAAGSEPTVQRAVGIPISARPSPKRNGSPARGLKAMSVAVGGASILALAGGAVLELSDWQVSAETEPEVAQSQPPQVLTPAPIAAVATSAPEIEWKLERTVDLALMKAAPAAEAAPSLQPRPKPPAVQTASKAAPATVESEPPKPEPEKDTQEAASFIAKPFVPAPKPASMPAAQKNAVISAPSAVVRSGDPRPDALFQHGRHKSTVTSGNGTINNRVASGGEPAEAAGSKSIVDIPSAPARTATARTGTVAGGGSGDPRGEGSGGARVGPDISGETGGATGRANARGGTDAGNGSAGGDGTPGGGSPSSGAGSGDTGRADAGGGSSSGGTGDSDTGGSAAGSEGSGGDDAGSGDSSDSDSGSSDGNDGSAAGIGGAIGGALGGLGDALGGALGGGKSDSEDQDQSD